MGNDSKEFFWEVTEIRQSGVAFTSHSKNISSTIMPRQGRSTLPGTRSPNSKDLVKCIPEFRRTKKKENSDGGGVMSLECDRMMTFAIGVGETAIPRRGAPDQLVHKQLDHPPLQSLRIRCHRVPSCTVCYGSSRDRSSRCVVAPGLLRRITGQRRFVRRRSIGGSVGRTSIHSLHFRLRLVPRLGFAQAVVAWLCWPQTAVAQPEDSGASPDMECGLSRCRGFCGVGVLVALGLRIWRDGAVNLRMVNGPAHNKAKCHVAYNDHR